MLATLTREVPDGPQWAHGFSKSTEANQPAPPAQFRTRPYRLIRYRQFNWKTNGAGTLKRIVADPAAERTKVTQFARDCLKAFHPSVVDIDHSPIPYRST
jgi:hypothetical protein